MRKDSKNDNKIIHAKWIRCKYVERRASGIIITYYQGGIKCSHCKSIFKEDMLGSKRYCPDCGAKMIKGKNK